MRKIVLIVAAAALAFGYATAPAAADWMPGDGHKMHYPQLPDPNGWDVDTTTDFIYDDWQCTGSGPVSDIHFWASSQNDGGGPLARIIVEIWSDLPADDPLNTNGFSQPGGKLWEHTFFPADWTVAGPWSGNQGWYAPNPGTVIPNDHFNYQQFNFDNFDDPFYQDEGTIYWLGIHTVPVSAEDAPWGWKTTQDHWNDDAAYYYGGWNELRDPQTLESLDMAFVITPEPGTLILFAIGGLFVARRRK